MARTKPKKITTKKPASPLKPPLPEVKTKEKTQVGVFLALMLAVISITFFSYLVFSAISTGSFRIAGTSESGAVYYVNCGVATNGSGTLSSPFNSISSAIASNSVTSGAKIAVQASNCTAEGRIVISKSNITLEAQGTVTTKGFTVFNLGAMQAVNNVTIRGFNITTDAGTDTINGPGIIVWGNDHLIENNIISNTYRQGIYLNGEYGYEVKRNIIRGNTVSRSGLSITNSDELFWAKGIVISGANATNNVVDNNNVFENGDAGIAVVGQASSNTVSNNRNIYNNGGPGINLSLGVANNIVEKNIVHGNCRKLDDAFGIDLFKVGNNNIVRYNIVYSQYDTLNDSNIGPNYGNEATGDTSKYGTGGIRFDGEVSSVTGGVWNATGNQAYYNSVYNERTGMAVLNFNNVGLYNNTVYNSIDDGLHFLAYNNAKTNFGGLIVKNNIIHTAGKAVGYMVRPNSTWSSYPVFNNNIYYQSAGAKFTWTLADQVGDGIVITTTEVDFAGWKRLAALSANGSDANSLISNPLLVNPSVANFGLSAGSPAIDAGVPLGFNSDITGQLLAGNPDIGAYESAVSVCVENWTCGQWTVCANSTQTRTCTDANSCGTVVSKPAVTQTCTVACTANCSGKVCGDDGCGGSCGTCAAGQACQAGQCVSSCVPATCASLGKNCGSQSNNCGGTLNCGTCTIGQTCTNGVCTAIKCTTNDCCKTNYSPYIYYNRYKGKCCKSTSFFTSNTNCVR